MSRANARVLPCAVFILGIGCSGAGIKAGPPTGGTGGAANLTDGGGVGAPGTGPDGPVCGIKTFGLRMVPPDLLIVLDKSGSMNQLPDGTMCAPDGGVIATCGPMGKWAQMTAAINQVVKQTETSIRWGLSTFPDDNDGCGVAATPVVPIDNQNAANIAAAMLSDPIMGRTPTRTALVNAGTYLAALGDPNPKFVLLATDGLPNCAPAGVSSGASDADGAIMAVTNLAAMGVPVFVVGIGDLAEAQMTLTAMAIAGGRPQAADPRYYPVSSTAELATVLTNIGGAIGRCSFGLGSAPPDPSNIAVTGDGLRIPKDLTHMNGWDYGTGGTSIQIYGSWCDQARAGTLKDIKAVFGCPGVVIP